MALMSLYPVQPKDMNIKLIIKSAHALTMGYVFAIDRQEVELRQTNHASSTTLIHHMITLNKEF